MNTDKELIGKIRKLRQIKPSKDWVVLTKTQLLGEEIGREQVSISFFPFWKMFWKPALATVSTFGVLFGLFAFSQNALPGELLYSVKKMVEKSQAVFVSESEMPKYNLEIANKRLEDLNEIAETHQGQRLAQAIEEVEKSKAKAVKDLSKIKDPKQAIEANQEIVKIRQNTEKIKSLGVVMGEAGDLENEYQNIAKSIAEEEIKELENGTLTDEQQEVLNQVKESFEAGDYNSALIKIYFLSN